VGEFLQDSGMLAGSLDGGGGLDFRF